MIHKNSCISIYKTHRETEDAIQELEHAGFDMKKLSIVGKGYQADEHAKGDDNTGDRVKLLGGQGAFRSGLRGLLFGSSFFLIPGIGPLAIGGPLVSTIVDEVEGAVLTGDLTALGAALFSIGIPKNSIIQYETAVQSDRFLLLVHGTQDEVNRAGDILGKNEAAEIAIHISD